uniref:Uncharacterized protein n=1 Tax=Cacopsylla melanoneura TaxID=428564 RepID=A0A8D9AYB7_9HEMI
MAPRPPWLTETWPLTLVRLLNRSPLPLHHQSQVTFTNQCMIREVICSKLSEMVLHFVRLNEANRRKERDRTRCMMWPVYWRDEWPWSFLTRIQRVKVNTIVTAGRNRRLALRLLYKPRNESFLSCELYWTQAPCINMAIMRT